MDLGKVNIQSVFNILSYKCHVHVFIFDENPHISTVQAGDTFISSQEISGNKHIIKSVGFIDGPITKHGKRAVVGFMVDGLKENLLKCNC